MSMAVWIAADQSEVRVGDYVAVNRSPDSIGRIVGVCEITGRPQVEITEGPGTGRTETMFVSQILTKAQRY